jgi:transcriptional regulator with XRE-family HTH domain
LARWRRRRGLSQSRLAALAGLSQPYLSELESGIKPLDRPSTQLKLAEALQISLAQLLDQPGYPDHTRNKVLAQVPGVRVALLELALGEKSAPSRSVETLRADVGDLVDIRNSGNWFGTMDRIAPLLRELAAHGRAGGELMTRALSVVRFALTHLGFDDLAGEAADLGVRAAAATGDGAHLSLARYSWVRSFPVEAAEIGLRAARGALASAKTDSRPAAEMTGWLHLLAAQQASYIGLGNEASTHLDEARMLAKLLGEPVRTATHTAGFAGNWFNTTTVDVWQMGVAARLRDIRWAMRIRDSIDLSTLPFPLGQAWYRLELSRALLAAGLEEEAVASLGIAERIAPQHFRMSRCSRELLSELMIRSRRRANRDPVLALAHRLGLSLQ